MLGAIFGDVVGSPYEFDNVKTKDFPLFTYNSVFTDDTVMTVAVAEALCECKDGDVEDFKARLVPIMHKYGRLYPDAGYGGRFLDWLIYGRTKPYGSYGNGSAMRVSPVARYAKTLEEAIAFARASAEVTHNHPEGIKGAEAVAALIFRARQGAKKEELRELASGYYDVDFTLDSVRPTYDFDETCQGSVPQAIVAFLESESFEDAIRCAVSIGGDSDTVAAICGSIAEAYYGMSENEMDEALLHLNAPLATVTKRFLKLAEQRNNGRLAQNAIFDN